MRSHLPTADSCRFSDRSLPERQSNEAFRRPLVDRPPATDDASVSVNAPNRLPTATTGPDSGARVLPLLAFGGQIQDRVDAFVHRPSAKVVLTILAEAEQGEVGTAALLTKARERGLARTSFFDLLGQLERAGLVERPRRGQVGLAPC